jgi:hypothetical protein
VAAFDRNAWSRSIGISGRNPRNPHDYDRFVPDEIGLEIATLSKVKRAASEAMADFAKDVLPGSVVRTLSIEVRDGSGPVLRVVLRFEIVHVAVH